MIEWKRLYAKPAGSLPCGVVTQYGVGAITVFILLFLTYWIWFGGGQPAELPGATETEQTAPGSFTDRMAAPRPNERRRIERCGRGSNSKPTPPESVPVEGIVTLSALISIW